jgi:hypothetical protein
MTPLRMQVLKPEVIAAVLRAKTNDIDESLLVEARTTPQRWDRRCRC